MIDDALTTFNKLQKYLGFASINDLSMLSDPLNFSQLPKNKNKLDSHLSIKNFLSNNFAFKNMIPEEIRKTLKKKIEKQILHKKYNPSTNDYNFIKKKYLEKKVRENFNKLSFLLKKDLQRLWFKK
jgi:hypothetical protein